MYKIITLITFLLFSFSANAKALKIFDGDSFLINNVEIRLQGIDAPEYNQMCRDKENKEYSCGIVAKNKLRQLMYEGVEKLRNVDKAIKCSIQGRDNYDRIIGICYNKLGKDINKEMVLSGNAIAYERYYKAYVPDQEFAKTNKLGIWQGKFEIPERWRWMNKRK